MYVVLELEHRLNRGVVVDEIEYCGSRVIKCDSLEDGRAFIQQKKEENLKRGWEIKTTYESSRTLSVVLVKGTSYLRFGLEEVEEVK